MKNNKEQCLSETKNINSSEIPNEILVGYVFKKYILYRVQELCAYILAIRSHKLFIEPSNRLKKNRHIILFIFIIRCKS